MNERQLAEAVAGKGFLGSYLAYARSLTAAPLIFHLTSGLAITGAAVGSNVSFMGAGDTEYWPNQYHLLLGPSGIHKTTAMNVGLELLRRAVPGSVYSDQYSQEAFIVGLRDRPNRLLNVEEFATLLAEMERSYMVGLKETLTKLYDPRQEFVRSLRGEGEIRVVRPSVTILGGSTIDWLVAHLKEVDFISGFMPRFLLWPSETKEPEPPGGALAKADPQAKNALILQLGRLAAVRRKPDGANVSMSVAAVQRIRRLNDDYRRRRDEEGTPKELDGLYSRCGNYAAKVATLLTVADTGYAAEYEVDEDAAKRACQLMSWLIDRAGELFERHIVFEKFEREAQAMLRLIPDTGIAWSEALKKSRRSADQFKAIIGTLKERGQVTEDSKATAGRQGRYLYRRYPAVLSLSGKDGKEGEESGKEVGKEVDGSGFLPNEWERSGKKWEPGEKEVAQNGAVVPLRRVQTGAEGAEMSG